MHQAPSVLQGRGGTSSLWGVWHQDEALWHGPMPYEGGDGQRHLWRRHLQSLCSTLEWCSWADGLIGPEPLLQVSVRGQHGTDALLPFRREKDRINSILLSERQGGADFRGGGSGLGRTRPFQLGGHRLVGPSWETESTLRSSIGVQV